MITPRRDFRNLPRPHFLLIALSVVFSLCYVHHKVHVQWKQNGPKIPAQRRAYTQTLVVSSTAAEDVSWISHELPELQTAIYINDDASAILHPPANKGHEAMPYLTYIIDHYHNFTSDVIIFTHAHQTTWHNNHVFDDDMAQTLRNLNMEHVIDEGYFNLRCHPESGCPRHLSPQNTHFDYWKQEQMHLAKAWTELHGDDVPVPSEISAPCCSQFAVSRERLLSVPLERWTHYRDWLLQTDLQDSVSGRIMEFQWHFILTGKPVHCPNMDQCYCKGYGVCFGSEERLESWLALRQMQAMQEDQIRLYRERGYEDTEWLDWRLDKGIKEPMATRLQEAMLRGHAMRESGDMLPWRDDRGY